MNEQTPIDDAGIGGTMRLSQPALDVLKAEIDAIAGSAKQGYWNERADGDDVRLCRWDGQSSDGLKHEDDLGEPPDPFEGACDTRARIADCVCNEKVMLLVLAAMRADIRAAPVEGTDVGKAGAATVALRWLIFNHLGIRWIREVIRLANYYLADSPAVAMMQVLWQRKTALRRETLTTEQMMDMYVKRYATQAEEAQQAGEETGEEPAIDIEAARDASIQFIAALQDPGVGTEMLADSLMQFFPEVSRKRALRAIKSLRKSGSAEFPVPYVQREGIEVVARRLFEDWFVPMNTKDFETCRVWFVVDWMTKTQVVEKMVSDGWSKDFVEEVVGTEDKTKPGFEGVASLPEYYRDTEGTLTARSSEFYRGLYEIVTAHYIACDDDGVPGCYYVVLHRSATTTATDRRLLDLPHAGYCGQAFVREMRTARIMESRGIPQIAGPYQGILKLHADSFGNHAVIAGVPPIITRGRQRMGVLRIAPLVELQAKRDGDFKWLQPPQYPATVKDAGAEIRRQIDEYFGRTNNEVPDDLVRLHREFEVMWFLAQLREVIVQMWAQFAKYAGPDMLKRITNHGEAVVLSPDTLSGEMDISIHFDPRDLDIANLETEAKIIKDVLMAMDRDKTIQAAPIVSALLWRVSPNLAQLSLTSVDKANTEELADEVQQYLKIRGGTEPELPDDGSINYGLRARMYEMLREANPEVYSDLAPDKIKILEARVNLLRTLEQQYGANVEIGRQGGKTALPQQVGA